MRNRWCKICFQIVNNLSSHTEQHHRWKRRYRCSYCKKSFLSPDNLKVHRKTHAKLHSYECLTCNATFKSVKKFKLHQQGHKATKPYKCELCNKRFIHRETLKKHILKHPGSEDTFSIQTDETGPNLGLIAEVVRDETCETNKENNKCTLCGKSYR